MTSSMFHITKYTFETEKQALQNVNLIAEFPGNSINVSFKRYLYYDICGDNSPCGLRKTYSIRVSSFKLNCVQYFFGISFDHLTISKNVKTELHGKCKTFIVINFKRYIFIVQSFSQLFSVLSHFAGKRDINI